MSRRTPGRTDGAARPAGNPHGNRSAVEMELSVEDRGEFDRLLGTGRLTLDGLVLWLAGKGYEISRSSVHRYKSRYDQWAARIRRSREATQVLAAELGDAAVQGQHGRRLVEMARILVDDFMSTLPEDRQLDAKEIALLGKGMAELARAARLDQDFEVKVREAAEKARQALLAEQSAKLDALGGVSEAARRDIREALGIR